jgi:acyl-CoA synthetase (AMP-forming)/AMP-acid ligase II
MSASACDAGGLGNPPRADDYLDANGHIALPDGISLITFLDRSIVHCGHAVAYRYLFAPELPGHAERLNAVIHDAQPTVFLTTTAASEAVATCVRMIPHARRPRVIAIDEIPDSVGATYSPAQLATDDIAYLQYTSGSTRTPMGVEITHRAAGTNLLQMILSIRLDNTDIHGVSWLPFYHDMGLLMIGFPALYDGHLTFMSPMAFIRRPQRWIHALSAGSRRGRVVSPAPNFAFELVAQRGLPAEGGTSI